MRAWKRAGGWRASSEKSVGRASLWGRRTAMSTWREGEAGCGATGAYQRRKGTRSFPLALHCRASRGHCETLNPSTGHPFHHRRTAPLERVEQADPWYDATRRVRFPRSVSALAPGTTAFFTSRYEFEETCPSFLPSFFLFSSPREKNRESKNRSTNRCILNDA